MEEVTVIFVKDFNNLEMQCKLIHSYGAQIINFLPIINGVAIKVDWTIISKLEQHDCIVGIYADGYVVRATSDIHGV